MYNSLLLLENRKYLGCYFLVSQVWACLPYRIIIKKTSWKNDW